MGIFQIKLNIKYKKYCQKPFLIIMFFKFNIKVTN